MRPSRVQGESARDATDPRVVRDRKSVRDGLILTVQPKASGIIAASRNAVQLPTKASLSN